jgi:hypothetical protein
MEKNKMENKKNLLSDIRKLLDSKNDLTKLNNRIILISEEFEIYFHTVKALVGDRVKIDNRDFMGIALHQVFKISSIRLNHDDAYLEYLIDVGGESVWLINGDFTVITDKENIKTIEYYFEPT